jgi:hypothetical protein
LGGRWAERAARTWGSSTITSARHCDTRAAQTEKIREDRRQDQREEQREDQREKIRENTLHISFKKKDD